MVERVYRVVFGTRYGEMWCYLRGTSPTDALRPVGHLKLGDAPHSVGIAEWHVKSIRVSHAAMAAVSRPAFHTQVYRVRSK